MKIEVSSNKEHLIFGQYAQEGASEDGKGKI